ncbi:MAG: membrane protein insertion efficiency factor YidD [bacterium]
MKHIILILIKFYKMAISPYLPSSCRFYPTCSEYAMEAVKIHGAAKGSWLAFKRISRCHPFNKGGYDPVIEDRK